MPEISRFFGIIIVMYWSDVGKHNRPYFHALYNDYSCVISIPELDILKGKLPNRIMKLVIEWASIHRLELLTNWECIKNYTQPKPIKPLEL
jgi:hypothetical protein